MPAGIKIYMSHVSEYFATCPKGLEGLLAAEIRQLGEACGCAGEAVRETVAGVYFQGALTLAYSVCLWSRLANKVLLPLSRFEAGSAEDLYQGARAIPWQEHLNPHGTLAVDFIGTSEAIRNSQFGALKVKDAIVDCLRDYCGQRPSVAKRDPDLRINAHLAKGKLILGLDLSGDSLHRRGYRTRQGAAPLKENLAAAVLLRAGWPPLAAEGGALLDPMCGSGTLLIEGALMAADIAPGLLRPRFGFERWLNHRNDIWLQLREEAIARRERGLAALQNEIRGYDADVRVIRAAESNILQAGLGDRVRIIHKSLSELKKPTHTAIATGLVICNPPYGERLGEKEQLKGLYRQLGQRLGAEFSGWRAAILTGNPELGKQMGLRAHKKYKLFNGTLPSELLLFNVDEHAVVRTQPWPETGTSPHTGSPWPETGTFPHTDSPSAAAAELTPGANMVANRLRKNQKSLVKWLSREAIDCYRLYDADMPEYAAAVDIYRDRGGDLYAHVQEYAAPKTVDADKANVRLEELLTALPAALDIEPSRISLKQRRRNRGTRQYEKLNGRGIQGQGMRGREYDDQDRITVCECGANFSVDLWRYLDTGLFLDHRPVRRWIARQAQGRRFLNLFCYTASASVQAALAGAAGSVSVDMSRTYLDWARKNYALNNISEKRHQLVQSDCFDWLRNCREPFDLIMLDPPSFSNSKRMEGVLDIQRDHVGLINRCMELLKPGGLLLFSTNLRSFKLEREALSRYAIEDITDATLDPDFQRNRKIHQCFTIRYT